VEEARIKTVTSMCSFTAQLIQFKVIQRRLIAVNVYKACYFFVYTD